MLTAAAMFPTAAAVMMFAMMITHHIGIISQLTGSQRLCRCIGITGNTAIQPDAGFSQCHLRTAADATADQRINLQCSQHARKGAVAAAIGAHHFSIYDLTVLNLVDLKLLGVAEMLKNLAIFISNCNFHTVFSFALVHF